MSKSKIALIILLVIVAAIVIAAVVADKKFAVISASPRVPVESLASNQVRGMLTVDVPKLKGIIEQKFLKGTSVPPSVLPLVLPYEAGLVANLDYDKNEIQVKLAINDQRLSPVLLEQANAAKIPAPWSQWFADKMKQEKPGLLTKDGAVPMDKTSLAKVREIWQSTTVPDPIKLKGNHLIELALDNRDGAVVAIGASMATAINPKNANAIPAALAQYQGMIMDIAAVRLFGDITPENTLKVTLVLEGSPEMDPSMLNILAMGMDYAVLTQIKPSMKDLGIEGKAAAKDGNVEGVYTIKNLDALLAML